MSAERDTDRQLRAFVAEGVDHAPERFVWAALDEIEQIPQRRPWRTALDGVSLRLRPASGLLGVAAVVAFALLFVLPQLAPNLPGDTDQQFTTGDLNSIVLWEDTMPSTWTLDNLVSNPDHVLEIPDRSVSPLRNPDPTRGYLWGRYTDFSAPDGAYMSWAALYDSPAAAAAALPYFQDEMASPLAWELGPGTPVDLGDGGHLYSGMTTSFVGPPGSGDPIPANIYLWRDGNLLLGIGGWFDFDPDEVRALAEAMDARAAAAAAR